MRSSQAAVPRLALGVALWGFFGGAAFALPLLDFRINDVTGLVEVADPVWTGSNYDISYVIDPDDSDGEMELAVIASSPLDDLDPRLVLGDDGSSWVVWWRDGAVDEVLLRKRSGSTGAWGPELRVSEAGESSRRPRIVTDGHRVWVAYQFDSGSQTSIGVNVINDEPDPMGCRHVLKTTSFGAVDVTAHSETGHVWVTWVDSSSKVGWSEYDAGTDSWSAPLYQTYVPGDVRGARAVIRSMVLQP
jgi:hypothetical protein